VFVSTVAAALLAVAFASTVFADTVTVTGVATGQYSTATVVCEFNSQTNTFTFTITNTSAITQAGSTSSITAIGFDLPPMGNASASGLNGFTGIQAPSLSSNFAFADSDLGSVPSFAAAVLDFGFITGPSGTFASGSVNDGLLPGESASFTVSGAAFSGFTEGNICNAIAVRFANINTDPTSDVGVTGSSSLLRFQPDARIKRSGGSLRGDDVYNTTGEDQTVAFRTRAGSLRRVYLTVQNDGNGPSSFQLDVTGSSPTGYEVRYFVSRSDVEITTEVEAGTFVTPELQPGQVFRIRARVVTTQDAQMGSELSKLFTFTADQDSSAKDAAKMVVRRR
jgi:hypothetical protein